MEEGIPVERAAKRYNVPITTLKDRVRGKVDIDTTRSGPRTVFTQTQEAYLARHLIVMGEVGFGYSRQETLNLASDYAFHLGTRDRAHPLGYDWFYGFMSRWPDLKVVKPRSLEAARAKSATQNVIHNYFRELEAILDKYNLRDKPQCIYNIDEKGLNVEHKPPKIVAGHKYKVQAVTSGKSQNVTLIGCVNAAGQQVPPFFIFPGKRMLDSLLDGSSPGADGLVSETGWSNSETFSHYMKEHLLKFLPARGSDSVVLVLYDGHRSHITIPLIEWARQQHIVLFVFPPHCSHILQPLDVSCYGPLQLSWNSACHKHLRESGGKVITRYDVCRLACRAYTSTLSSSNIQAAFQKSGVFPFDPSMISPVATAPSLAFQHPSSNSTEHSMSAEAFLENKGGQILKNVQTAKVRNTLSKVVGGKPITEPDVAAAVKRHIGAQKQKPKSVANKQPANPAKKKAKVTQVPDLPVPGPSRLQRQLSQHEDDSDSDDSISESDKCIVCHLFYPKEKNLYQSLNIVKWGQCDKCDGWVHLSFCTPVKVLRRGDSFLCPRCKDDEQ